MNGKTRTDIFRTPPPKCCYYFLNSVLVFLLFVFIIGFAEIKTVKLWSSALLIGNKSITIFLY